MESDKYAGIITVIAVILAVIYANGNYDIWDAVLGLLVIILSFKYRNDINRDILSALLSAFLFSLGVGVILYTVLPFLPCSEILLKFAYCKYSIIDAQFLLVSILTLVVAISWYILSHNKTLKNE